MEPPVSKANSHRKKMIAPIVITAVLLIYYIVFFSFLLSVLPDTASRLLLGIIPVLSGAVLIGVCMQRIKEIKGGEEDDLGQYIQSKNIGKDITQAFKTLVGGELKAYNEMMNEARAMATKRMVAEAEELGADAIVNIRYASSAVMQGAAEVIAYGTAVRFRT